MLFPEWCDSTPDSRPTPERSSSKAVQPSTRFSLYFDRHIAFAWPEIELHPSPKILPLFPLRLAASAAPEASAIYPPEILPLFRLAQSGNVHIGMISLGQLCQTGQKAGWASTRPHAKFNRMNRNPLGPASDSLQLPFR